MKRVIFESCLGSLLYFLSFTKVHNALKPFYAGKGHIHMFHKILPEVNYNKYINNEIELSINDFERYISYYRSNNYIFLSIDELYDLLIKQRNLDNKFVCFTFDDGYVSNLLYAYPILKKYDIPFTINLVSGYADRTAIIWWYLLEDLLFKYDMINFELEGKTYSFECETVSKKWLTFRKLRGIIIRSTSLDNYMLRLHSIFDSYNIDLYKKTEELAMDWEQIKFIANDPRATIAAHTVNHLALNKISVEEANKDIIESVKRIEQQLGKKVEHFSYPFGRRESGPREFDIVKNCGFKTAVTTRFANIFDEHCDYLHCLPRIYKFGRSKNDYLDVYASGALSALIYKLKKIVTK